MSAKRTRATRQALQPEAGVWRRFSRYEIANGYIRPTADATLERFTLGPDLRDADGRRPYETLAEIVRQGRYTVAEQALTAETESGLLAWCQRFGLLGVLLQRVETVVFPPQTLPARGDRRRMVARNCLVRTPRGWQMVCSMVDLDAPSLAGARASGEVMLHPLNSFQITPEPIATTWARFFPSFQAESYEGFHPGYDEFFQMYQEPIEEFFRAASELIDALETIARIAGQESQDSDSRFNLRSAINVLDGLASATRLHHQLTNDDGLVEQWIAPTLLSSLALMAFHDLAGGRELRNCENRTCSRLYVSGAYQARYCSERCRQTVNKRTFRQNERLKKRARMRRRRSK